MTRPAFLLVLIGAVTFGTRSYAPDQSSAAVAGAALALGLMVLAGIQSAHLFGSLRLPHVTAYMICGAVLGPEVTGLLTHDMLHDFVEVKGLAVALIALRAGCELDVRALASRLRSIGATTVGGTLGAMALLTGVLFGVTAFLPATSSLTPVQRLGVSWLCATCLCALSPSVVLGLVAELRAAGPLTELCISVVVLSDLLIALGFSLVSTVVHGLFPDHAAASGLSRLLVHVFGSLLAGAGIGLLLIQYVRRIGLRLGLVIFGLLFVVGEAAGPLHLNPLLVGLAAGMVLKNLSSEGGEAALHQTDPAKMPTFAVYFGVIGAGLHLSALFGVFGFALLLAATRGAGLYLGARAGASLAGTAPDIARRAPLGMLPQAGLAIALASEVKEGFHTFGPSLSTLVVGAVVVSELVGPLVFRATLAASPDAGQRSSATDAASHVAAAPAH